VWRQAARFTPAWQAIAGTLDDRDHKRQLGISDWRAVDRPDSHIPSSHQRIHFLRTPRKPVRRESRRFPAGANPARSIGRSAGSHQSKEGGNEFVEILWCKGSLPPWIANRLAHLDLNKIDLNHGPLANYFEHLAHENTAKSRAIVVKADQIADSLNPDDTLLDGLLVGLGLE
jgi:hypothetical protein